MKLIALALVVICSNSVNAFIFPGDRCYPLYGCQCVADDKKENPVDCPRGYVCALDGKGAPYCQGLPKELKTPCTENIKECACYKNEKNEGVHCTKDEECYSIDYYNNLCFRKDTFIGPGEKCTNGGCICGSKDTNVAQRRDWCQNPGDVCAAEPDIAGSFYCGPAEGKVEIKGGAKCGGKACPDGHFCYTNGLGAHCIKPNPEPLKFDYSLNANGPVQSNACFAVEIKDKVGILKTDSCAVEKGCYLDYEGTVRCWDTAFTYPVIHDNEICTDKAQGCYCVHPTKHEIKALCWTGAMCNVYESSVECTKFSLFNFVECRLKGECYCGTTTTFEAEKGDRYCRRKFKEESGHYIQPKDMTDPDSLLNQRIIRELHLLKLRNKEVIKMATKDYKKVIHISRDR